MCTAYGIDKDRLLVIQTNSPKDIFDQIEKDIAAYCQGGAPIKMIVIDSVSGIQGRREIENESVIKMTIGDHAQTVQIGLKRILPVIRKHDIALVCILQVRAEMDMAEQMRGNKYKMQAGFGLQHMAEYFIAVEPNRTIGGRKDILGNEFVNEDVKDFVNKGEQTAMKIRVKMKDSSMGPKGRTAEFTFDFKRGLVNIHEEVYKLGTGYGVIENPKQGYYSFNGEQWHGEGATVKALELDKGICDAIIAELYARDQRGDFASSDLAAEGKDDGETELLV
jgi:RecA/RadA recombinase